MTRGLALSAGEPPQMTCGRKDDHHDDDPGERTKAQHGEAQAQGWSWSRHMHIDERVDRRRQRSRWWK